MRVTAGRPWNVALENETFSRPCVSPCIGAVSRLEHHQSSSSQKIGRLVPIDVSVASKLHHTWWYYQIRPKYAWKIILTFCCLLLRWSKDSFLSLRYIFHAKHQLQIFARNVVEWDIFGYFLPLWISTWSSMTITIIFMSLWLVWLLWQKRKLRS